MALGPRVRAPDEGLEDAFPVLLCYARPPVHDAEGQKPVVLTDLEIHRLTAGVPEGVLEEVGDRPEGLYEVEASDQERVPRG